MPKLVYACDHCGQFFAEDKIFEHQDECVYNPKNKKCASCKFCQETKIYDGQWLVSARVECRYKAKHEPLPPNQIYASFGEVVSINHTCEHWTERK